MSISEIVTLFGAACAIATNAAVLAYNYAKLKKTIDTNEELIEKLKLELLDLGSSCREEFKPMGTLSLAVESLNKSVSDLEEHTASNMRLKPIIESISSAVHEIDQTIKREIFGRLRTVETDLTVLKTIREVNDEHT